MCKEAGQARFLDVFDFALAVLLLHGSDVHDTWDSRSDQPRQTHQRVHQDHDGRNAGVVVVGVSVGESVTWVVDNVPRDTVVQESQDERWNTKSGGNEDNVDFAVEIKQVNQPWSATPCFGLGGAVSGPVRAAVLGTAGEGRRESVWDIELFHLNILEDGVSQSRHDDDRKG